MPVCGEADGEHPHHGPLMDLFEGTGHWVWIREEGYQELEYEVWGRSRLNLMSTFERWFGRAPEHFYSIMNDGRWQCRVVTTWTGEGGSVDILDKSGIEQMVDYVPGICVCSRGSVRSYLTRQGTHVMLATLHLDGRDFDIRLTTGILGEELHLTLEDLSLNTRGTRVFRRIPCFTVVNPLGQTVTMTTYDKDDFMEAVSSMEKEIPPGISILEFKNVNIDEEQAFFSLPDGREWDVDVYSGDIYTLNIKKFRNN